MHPKNDLEGLDVVYQLKSVYRFGQVGDRQESAAEHSWSCLLVADLFLDKISKPLNRLRVYELLMYHDLVEVIAGDTPLGPEFEHIDKETLEANASKELRKQLPHPLDKRFVDLHEEFIAQETREAVFAKLVDGFESDTFTRKADADWSSWTKEYHDSKRLKYFEAFPELKPYYDELQRQLVEQGVL